MKTIKRVGIAMTCFIGVIIVLFIAYLTYLVISYSRIKDQQPMSIENQQSVTEESVVLQKTYSIMTYNIGFGAYSDDYTFFMDGGKNSRAISKESVMSNLKGDLKQIQKKDPDFLYLQEVDQDSTRSYHVNQYEYFKGELAEYCSNDAINYDSAYLFYPFTEPHGASLSSLNTYSKVLMSSTIRRSLPISTGLYKYLDLDRCYSVSRVAVENGKELILYNVHLSAYTDDLSIVEGQIEMLMDDIQEEIEKGNYIICGGDFNQDLLGNSPQIFKTEESNVNWAKAFPKELLQGGMHFAYEFLSEEEIKAIIPTARNADIPYKKGESFVTMLDGFIISDNIQVIQYENIDTEFKNSDHNPVYMEFQLQ